MNGSPIGIIVLAAGASTRMGEPKQRLRYEGETLLRRAVKAALASGCRPVIVVLGAHADALREEAAGTSAHIVLNSAWAQGMSASIRCGLNALEEGSAGRAQAAVLTLCDQPLVTDEIINRLLEAYDARQSPLVVSEYTSRSEKTRGVPALFDRALFAELMSLNGAQGAKRIIERHSASAIAIAMPEAAFDVDTPCDYRALNDLRIQQNDAAWSDRIFQIIRRRISWSHLKMQEELLPLLRKRRRRSANPRTSPSSTPEET